MKKVAVLLAEGFEEIEAVTPIDLLLRAGIQVITAGVGKRTVKGAHGIVVEADVLVEELKDDLDGVVIPGGMPGAENLAASPTVGKVVTRISREGGMVAAICASPGVVLGPLGILRGKNAVCYPGFEEKMTGALSSKDTTVADGPVITSKGPGTAFEFSLSIIRFLLGRETADNIAKAAQYAGK